MQHNVKDDLVFVMQYAVSDRINSSNLNDRHQASQCCSRRRYLRICQLGLNITEDHSAHTENQLLSWPQQQSEYHGLQDFFDCLFVLFILPSNQVFDAEVVDVLHAQHVVNHRITGSYSSNGRVQREKLQLFCPTTLFSRQYFLSGTIFRNSKSNWFRKRS